jgi:hypothetical protein
MALRRITSISEVTEHLEKEIEKREKVIINTLKYVGEQCVNDARMNGDYMDQTGNLRSSIGYVVVKNGIVLSLSKFNKVKSSSEGKSEGLELANKLASKSTTGIVLIVVAGMNYASYVETNRNVITSSELLAEKLVPQLLKQLGFTVR